MRSPFIVLISVLGFLPSLIFALVHEAVEGVPVYSTLKQPFTLLSRQPEGAHVVVNGDGTPVVTFDKRASTQFKLTNGSLTTLGGGLSAVYGPGPLPLPPPLTPIKFRKNARPGDEVPFVAATHIGSHGKQSLTLTALGERKLEDKMI